MMFQKRSELKGRDKKKKSKPKFLNKKQETFKLLLIFVKIYFC